MNNLEEINETLFESIKHVDKKGLEYWHARELQKAMGYTEYRKFLPTIKKAMESCETSNSIVSDHFAHVSEMINLAKNAKRKVADYKLSRYACYLIAQNADPRKKVVALAQTYFAVQTRKQELFEKEYERLSEDEKRLYHRNLTKKGNYILNQTAKNAGVKNFDKFHNAGYKGLYGGQTADDIAKRKGLRYREDILDNMSSSELIANSFRIDQTNQKLKNDKVKGEKNARDTHYKVGKEVRNTIKKLGGTLPENLPTPKKSLKEIEKENKKTNTF